MSKEIIKITKSACIKLGNIAKQQNNKNLFFSIRGGGCNGFKYSIEPMNFKPNTSIECIKREDFNLYICDYSIMHIWGTTIDWKKDIMGETFHFENPEAASKCGCGTSFRSKKQNN
tara:strand:+ start:48 stop:395 length:348 start_codon:yes stop_codon:yes gene_type:complete